MRVVRRSRLRSGWRGDDRRSHIARVRRFSCRVADVGGHRLAPAVVAAFLDCTPQLRDRCLGRVVADHGRLSDGVRLDSVHSRMACKHRLDHRFLRSAQHRTNVEDRGFHLMHCVVHSVGPVRS